MIFLNVFQNLQPMIPAIWILLLALVCLAAGYWSYQHLTNIPAAKRRILITLRSVALLILALLLLHPYLVRETTDLQKPSLYLYVDNSQSMNIERGRFEGLDSIQKLIHSLQLELEDTFEITPYLFGSDVVQTEIAKTLRVDEDAGTLPVVPGLNGAYNRTNLQHVMEHIAQNQRQTDVSVLISDGIFTEGRNPVFTAQKLTTPVIAVPAGDTSSTRDLVLTAEPLPEIIQTGTTLMVRGELRQTGFERTSAEIRLLINGEVKFRDVISFEAASSLHTLNTEFTLDEAMEGLAEFRWEADLLEGEITGENNESVQLVDVLPRDLLVLSAGFELHPDVAALRRVIASDQSYELITADYLQRNRVFGTDPLELPKKPGLVVIHGLPEPGHPFLAWLEEHDEIPQVWLISPGGLERLQSLGNRTIFPFNIVNRGGFLPIKLSIPDGAELHPILELNDPDFRRFPDLTVHQSQVILPDAAEYLMMATYQGVETDIPVLSVDDDGIRKRSFVTAFGWSKMEKSTNEEAASTFQELFSYIFSWTLTPPGKQQLTLIPAKNTFTNLENVTWTARLLNERNEPEPDASVDVEIERTSVRSSGDTNPAEPDYDALQQQAEIQRFRMVHDQRETYRLNGGRFPEGNYRVRATASKGDRILGQAESRFVVGTSPEEFLQTRRNDALMQQIADVTGGRLISFISENEPAADQILLPVLEDLDLVQLRSRLTVETRYLINWPAWFILVLLMLSSEWMLRRSLSLP